jgi:hypothetical protein
MLLSMKSVELLNLKILMRGLGYRKEVGVVQMWSDMYRDRGEYIWTWLETGEVREWTDVPLQFARLLYCFQRIYEVLLGYLALDM